MKSYKELIVWQKSIELTEEIYRLTSLFPKEEIYGLSSQMKRASVSIASNIAEGFGRRYSKEFNQFLRLSYGSAFELETQLIIAQRLKLANPKEFEKSNKLVEEVLKMLNKLDSVIASKISANH